jgi:glycosyltransferase involved in cell wall biosynthesis
MNPKLKTKFEFDTYVIIPVYNEERNIIQVINKIPTRVKNIIIVDDKSTDRTINVINSKKNINLKKCVLLTHDRNLGQGAARATGFNYLLQKKKIQGVEEFLGNSKHTLSNKNDDDLIIVLDGDGQMDPTEIDLFINARKLSNADFIKGDRFETPNLLKIMPKIRILGNILLSLMTKISSGYWFLSDSQCGYFGFTRKAAKKIDWNKLVKGYGQINELIILASFLDFKASKVSIQAIYGVGEVSGIKIRKVWHVIIKICLKGFMRRIFVKNIIWQTQPFAFFYLGSVITFFGFLYFLISSIVQKIEVGVFPTLGSVTTMFLYLISILTFVQGLVFDLQHNEKYNVGN